MNRKRCFLEQDKWKTVSWALEPASKDTMSYLQDIMCDLPGLMDEAVNIQSPSLGVVQKAISYEALSRNILDHIDQLYQWRRRWEDEYPNAYYEVAAQPHLDVQPLFPTMLRFSNIRQADEIVLYNTALILLLRLGAKVMGPAFDTSTAIFNLPAIDSLGSLSQPGETEIVQTVATEICKCVGYYLLDYRNRAGVSLLISLRVAHTAFLPTSGPAKWIDTLMTRIAELNGFTISKRVHSNTLNLFSTIS